MSDISPLLGLLGDEQPFVYRNSPDRFGFSWILASILKKRYPARAFCDWLHGWVWWEELMKAEDLVGPRGAHRNMSVVVGNLAELKLLTEEGYRNLTVGGLPFAYVNHQQTPRCEHSLLAFIGKSAEGERFNVLDTNYLDFLESQTGEFEHIYVSIATFDRSDNIIREVKRRSLTPVPGANPTDKRSLLRTRIALEHCKYVSSNTFGSHIAYALSAGCNVSIFTPLFRYSKDAWLLSQHGHSRDYVDRMENVFSEPYLRKKWPSLFRDIPKNGYCDISEGLRSIGSDSRLNSIELTKVLGWDLRGQIRGYTSGGLRRVYRKAPSFKLFSLSA
jgi:hypothetical protein